MVERDATLTSPETHSDDSGRDSEESAATKASFSSLINYNPSSQLGPGTTSTTAGFSTRLAPPRTMTTKKKKTVTLVKTSQAEMLRLRLKVAMYKVRTNQIYIPFARLQVHRPATKTLRVPRTLDPALTPASSSPPPELHTHPSSPVEDHAEGDADLPRLRPAPILAPTAFSSRMVFGPLLHGTDTGYADEENSRQILPRRRSSSRTVDDRTALPTPRPSRPDVLSSDEATIVAEDMEAEARELVTSPGIETAN